MELPSILFYLELLVSIFVYWKFWFQSVCNLTISARVFQLHAFLPVWCWIWVSAQRYPPLWLRVPAIPIFCFGFEPRYLVTCKNSVVGRFFSCPALLVHILGCKQSSPSKVNILKAK
jgi:hypothetical protein